MTAHDPAVVVFERIVAAARAGIRIDPIVSPHDHPVRLPGNWRQASPSPYGAGRYRNHWHR